MIQAINNSEIDERIRLNLKRLCEYPYYQKEQIFAPSDYDWYGDKEGRALLSFVSHYKISKTKIPAMDYLISALADKVNELGYLGPIYDNEIHEQQLSGHSWLLRGLCEYYEQFNDLSVIKHINEITDNLFIKHAGKFKGYPVDRSDVYEGDVSGSVSSKLSEWILSTDIGCAFMSVDGLSHVFKITKRNDVRELVREMAEVYVSIDKVKLKAQTHCTLTCARGLMRMYEETGETFYLDCAKEIFRLYTECGGMTLTYQNINWWGRPDTWTEPCAVVDSLILAAELYKATDDEKYRVYAARIYHNGFATLQRINGGAGTDSCVTSNGEHTLYAKMYEAYFCCTMRLAEGLWYISRNADLLYATLNGEVRKNNGVYADGDIIYAYVTGGAEDYAEQFTEKDGVRLCPLVKYYKVPENIILKSKQQIVFP